MDLLSLLQPPSRAGQKASPNSFISSTGHLIVAGDLLFTGTGRTFSLHPARRHLAVVWLYRERFLLVAKPRAEPEEQGVRR
jgi:undecaprenyl pyrophosphate phosphatase UppP